MLTFAEPATTRDAGWLNAYFEGSHELLHTIAGVLDICSIFPQMSEIVKRMLSHDALTLSSHDEDLNLHLEASSTDDLRGLTFDPVETHMAPELLVGDIRRDGLPSAKWTDGRVGVDARGYRSLLRVAMRAGHQVVVVGFWSRQAHAYTRHDVPLAQRIVSHIAICISHEQLARTASGGQTRTRHDLETRARAATDGPSGRTHDRMVGASIEWRAVLKEANKAARTDRTVLVTGESGTGKEVVARFIHRASARKSGPFVALNCAALPAQLLESELFGYERGAFTNAQQAKPGQIELASGGVLFVDEVTEISLAAQAKFLRVLQEREFERLGGTRMLKANVRVIAATSRDLKKAVEAGTFREDLYYRLQAFDITIAPLRHRRDDILPLSEAMLQDIGRAFGQPPQALTLAAQEALLQYNWPGNVRELRNALERAATRADGASIDATQLALQSTQRPPAAGSTNLRKVERDIIERVLRECTWNKVWAAKKLGLTRTQLYGRLRKYGLEVEETPAPE
jgi:transcriptional regulator with PAS, ATPase and Fis domain